MEQQLLYLPDQRVETCADHMCENIDPSRPSFSLFFRLGLSQTQRGYIGHILDGFASIKEG